MAKHNERIQPCISRSYFCSAGSEICALFYLGGELCGRNELKLHHAGRKIRLACLREAVCLVERRDDALFLYIHFNGDIRGSKRLGLAAAAVSDGHFEYDIARLVRNGERIAGNGDEVIVRQLAVFVGHAVYLHFVGIEHDADDAVIGQFILCRADIIPGQVRIFPVERGVGRGNGHRDLARNVFHNVVIIQLDSVVEGCRIGKRIGAARRCGNESAVFHFHGRTRRIGDGRKRIGEVRDRFAAQPCDGAGLLHCNREVRRGRIALVRIERYVLIRRSLFDGEVFVFDAERAAEVQRFALFDAADDQLDRIGLPAAELGAGAHMVGGEIHGVPAVRKVILRESAARYPLLAQVADIPGDARRFIDAQRDEGVSGNIRDGGSRKGEVARGLPVCLVGSIVEYLRSAGKPRLLVFQFGHRFGGNVREIITPAFHRTGNARPVSDLIDACGGIEAEYLIFLYFGSGRKVLRCVVAEIDVAEVQVDIRGFKIFLIVLVRAAACKVQGKPDEIGGRHVHRKPVVHKREFDNDARPGVRGKRTGRAAPCKLQRDHFVARVVHVEVHISIVAGARERGILYHDARFGRGGRERFVEHDVREPLRRLHGVVGGAHHRFVEIFRLNILEVEPAVFACDLFDAEFIFKVDKAALDSLLRPLQRNEIGIVRTRAELVLHMDDELVIPRAVLDGERIAAVQIFRDLFGFGAFGGEVIDGDGRLARVSPLCRKGRDIICVAVQVHRREAAVGKGDLGRLALEGDDERRVFDPFCRVDDGDDRGFFHDDGAADILDVVALRIFDGAYRDGVAAQYGAALVHDGRDGDLIFPQRRRGGAVPHINVRALAFRIAAARHEHARNQQAAGERRKRKQAHESVLHTFLLFFFIFAGEAGAVPPCLAVRTIRRGERYAACP